MDKPSDGRVGKDLHYEYKIFEDLIEPRGALAVDKRSHACWFYVTLAMKSLRAYAGGIENQIIQYRVGDTLPNWNESRFEEIARSVAIIYQLESPDEFLKTEWKKRAWTQAKMLGREIDRRVWDVGPGKPRLH